MRFLRIVSIVLITTVFVTPEVKASAGIDLHWLWDNRCFDCHGHSGDFARRFLNVSDGELQGWHHVHDLRRFLDNHYLAGKEVDKVYNMLLAQASIQARFKNECSSCHETAASFVRDRLLLRDGVLYSHVSGHPVHGFLDHHKNLKTDDVDFFTELLTRIAHEIFRP